MKNRDLTIDEIKDELHFAADVMRRLPLVRVQGYISAWPQIVYDKYEVLFGDIRPRVEKPMPCDVSRMDEVLEWLKVLTLEEKKLVWKRANKVPWKVLTHELGYCRSKLSEVYKIALNKIYIYLK